MDDTRQTVGGKTGEGQRGSPLAAATEPLRRAGPVGHERTRLAGRAWRKALSDCDDRRCHEPIIRTLCPARHDRTEHAPLWSYLERFGRPLAFYTDKASHFQTAEKRKRDEPGVDKDPVEMPATQIGRALRELGITWIAAHSPQAKGRVERNFQTAQDRLVKGMRVAGVKTIDQANRYLEEEYLVWWERELTVEAETPDDAHRPLDKSHHLAASLSHVETRQIRSDYTFRWEGSLYQIDRAAIVSGMRGADVRVEKRLDGSMAARFGEYYVKVELCPAPAKSPAKFLKPASPAKSRGRQSAARRGSDWNKNFDLHKAPRLWQAAQASGCRPEETIP